MPKRPREVKNIVWLQTGFLGDIILQTASLRLVKEHLPGVRQFLITTPLGQSALLGHPDIDGFALFAKRQGTWQSFREVKRGLDAFDLSAADTLLLKPHLSYRSSFLATYLGFYTITFQEAQCAFLSHRRQPRVAIFHEAHRIALLLEPLGIERKSILAAMPCMPMPAARFEKGPIRIGVAPGSVWETKKWPWQSFAELIAAMLENLPQVEIFLLGSEAEKETCQAIVQILKSPLRLTNLAGETSLSDLNALYPTLDLLISNDSSPVHYASAYKVETIAIFGATHPAMGFAPLASGSRIAEMRGLECRPCSDHGPKVCPLGHFKCMRELKASYVWQLVEDRLFGS